MKCSIHSAKELVPTKTRWGLRYSCSVGGCTVVCWNGSTSTPADYATRQTRIRAHEAFDALWQSGTMKRKTAYKMLAKHLGLTRRQTHLGQLNITQCERVITFCNALTRAK